MSKIYKVIDTKNAPAAIGAYSQGAIVGGVYYFSGQIGMDPKDGSVAIGFDAQLAQILRNIDGVLESQGLTRDNVFKTTIFMKDLSDFSKVNEEYEKYFTKPFPARSCVEVSRLPKDTLIEIEVMASK